MILKLYKIKFVFCFLALTEAADKGEPTVVTTKGVQPEGTVEPLSSCKLYLVAEENNCKKQLLIKTPPFLSNIGKANISKQF